MFSRITLILVTVFWLCMNFLLWRSEFGGRNHIGTSVPVEVVWQKILTAPDVSQLQIIHHGKDVGMGRWTANIGKEVTGPKIISDEVPPAAPMQKDTGFNVVFDGNFSAFDNPTRFSFNVGIIFATNQAWQEFHADLKLRPDRWTIHSKAAEQTLHFRMDNEDEKSDRVYKFSDLQSPQFLLQEFQLPISMQVLDALGLPVANQPGTALSPGLAWQARHDWIEIGHTSVRAFRLQARLFDRYSIIIIVSQVGEILRVELPDEWVLINTQFTNL